MKKIIIVALLLCIFLCICACSNAPAPQETQACVHQYEENITQEPSCSVEGTKTFICTNCSDSYTESIAKIDHNYTSSITTEANCSTEGVKKLTCTNCSDSYTEKINKTGHKYSEQIITAATCSTSGTKKYTCTYCNQSYSEAISLLGHDWIAATCTRAKYCSHCNQTDGQALGHQLANGKCSRCDYDEGTLPFNATVVAIKDHLLPSLKNPNSLQLNSVKYCYLPRCNDDETCICTILIDYSAMNGFGGYNRKDKFICIHGSADSYIMKYNSTGGNIGLTQTYINGTELNVNDIMDSVRG